MIRATFLFLLCLILWSCSVSDIESQSTSTDKTIVSLGKFTKGRTCYSGKKECFSPTVKICEAHQQQICFGYNRTRGCEAWN